MKELNQTELALRQEILARRMASEELLDGELSIEFMNACSSKVNRYLDLVRPNDVAAAYNRPQQIIANKKVLEHHEFRKFWQNTKEDVQTRLKIANDVATEFQQMFPQFFSCEESTTAIVRLIQERGQVFGLDTVISAYQSLCSQGLILVTPENCGLEGSEAVKGKMLMSLPNWERVLEPVHQLSDEEKERQRVANLSADQYKREFLPVDDTLPPIIQKRIEADILGFTKAHPEYDADNGTVGRDILVSWIREQGMPINRDSLEMSYKANYEALRAADCIFDEAPGIPVRAGVSTLIDHRKPAIPTNERSVVIREPESPKRFSLQEILSWDSATMLRMMQLYPHLQNQIDNM
jgi:hypothetical protein